MFHKAFGIAFLGEPRTELTAHAHDPGRAMRVPILVLATSCVLLGCSAPLLGAALSPVVERVSGLSTATVRGVLDSATVPLSFVGGAALAVLGLTALLAGLRRRLLSGRPWKRVARGIAYARPSPRMQYAGSFSQPLTELFGLLLRRRRTLTPPQGLFPSHASLGIETPDPWEQGFYTPLFGAIGRGLSALRWLQHGQVHLYVLYIALTLLVLLVWKVG